MSNLYAGQEATVRTRHGTTDWFQIGKGVCQGGIVSPCIFNLYAEWVQFNHSIISDSLRPHGLSMEFSRPEYWMGSLSLLQGIFLTQESNRGLLHCTRILYQLSLREVLYAEYIMQNAAQAG